MADIDVVPKHRSYTWLWIVIAIVVLALIIWALAGRSHSTAQWPLTAPGMLALAHAGVVLPVV